MFQGIGAAAAMPREFSALPSRLRSEISFFLSTKGASSPLYQRILADFHRLPPTQANRAAFMKFQVMAATLRRTGHAGVGEYFAPAAGVGEYFAPASGMGEYFAANGLGEDPQSMTLGPDMKPWIFGGVGAAAGLALGYALFRR